MEVFSAEIPRFQRNTCPMSCLYKDIGKAVDYRDNLKNALVVLKCFNPTDVGLNIRLCASWITDVRSVLNLLQLLCLFFSMYSFYSEHFS